MNPLPYCNEDQTLELMLECDKGNYSIAARDWLKIIGEHPAIIKIPSFQSAWTISECIGRLSDYFRKHFELKCN